MNPIREFCEKRMANKKIEEAFTAYVKASFADSFNLQKGDTINTLVMKMTPQDVDEMWRSFVLDFRDVLTG